MPQVPPPQPPMISDANVSFTGNVIPQKKSSPCVRFAWSCDLVVHLRHLPVVGDAGECDAHGDDDVPLFDVWVGVTRKIRGDPPIEVFAVEE